MNRARHRGYPVAVFWSWGGVVAQAATPADLMAARVQMAVSLGWHIVIASFGVGMPVVTVFMEWRGIRTGDATYLRLAHRWAKVMGLLFAVGRGFGHHPLLRDGPAVARPDGADLFAGLRGRALPLVALSVIAGAGSLGLLAAGQVRLVRITAGLAVAAMLWGWAAAQYPVLLRPDLTVRAAAGAPAAPAVLHTVLGALAVGALLVLPSLAWLFAVFQRGQKS